MKKEYKEKCECGFKNEKNFRVCPCRKSLVTSRPKREKRNRSHLKKRKSGVRTSSLGKLCLHFRI